jgi:AcrR family transcriptional regulator
MAEIPEKKAGKKKVKTRIKSSTVIGRRRRQIIEGAIKVFSAKGFHNATVREIAEEAGVTMGTLYNYISCKEDIIYMVYDHIGKIIRGDVEKAIFGIDDPKERLKAAVRQNLISINQYHDIVMFIDRSMTFVDRVSLHEALERETEYIELFEGLLRDYFKGKEVDETRIQLAADLLAYMPVIVTFRRWSLRRRFKSMDEAMKGILDFVLHGMEFVARKGS